MSQAAIGSEMSAGRALENDGRMVKLGFAIVIALVLLAAVASKFITQEVDGKVFTPTKTTLDWVVIAAQPIIALLIVVFHRRRLTWMCVALMFGAFAGWTGFALYNGTDCGCFSGWITTKTTLAIDLFGVAVGLALASMKPAPGRDPFGALATGTAVFAAIGVAFGSVMAPDVEGEIEEEGTSISRVLALPEHAAIGDAGPDDPAWLVFVYSLDCPHCQMYLPTFTKYENERNDDDVLRVRTIAMESLEADHEIPMWSWPHVPTTYLISGGVVLDEMTDEGPPPTPDEIRQRLDPGQAAIARLMNTPEMVDVKSGGSTDPHWLIFVYDPTCELCMEQYLMHNAYLQANGVEDSILRIRMFTKQELEERHGIAPWDWPGTPTTLLVHNGSIERVYKTGEGVDPFQLKSRFGG